MGIFLTFHHLVKLLSNRLANLSLENLKNTSNFDGWGLTRDAYKKNCSVPKIKLRLSKLKKADIFNLSEIYFSYLFYYLFLLSSGNKGNNLRLR